MTQAAIEALPVGALAADDCALFLWAVMPQLAQALSVIKAWGFTFRTCAFVWVKQTRDGERFATGMGNWTRPNAELCLLAVRGSPRRLYDASRRLLDSCRNLPFRWRMLEPGFSPSATDPGRLSQSSLTASFRRDRPPSAAPILFGRSRPGAASA